MNASLATLGVTLFAFSAHLMSTSKVIIANLAAEIALSVTEDPINVCNALLVLSWMLILAHVSAKMDATLTRSSKRV